MRAAIYLLLSLLATLATTKAVAEPTTDPNDLQKLCGFASDLFNRIPSTMQTPVGHVASIFQVHFSIKQNKCFVEHSMFVYKQVPVMNPTHDVYIQLIDLGDNKLLGQYFHEHDEPVFCAVGEKFCDSGGMWDLLMEPYMKE